MSCVDHSVRIPKLLFISMYSMELSLVDVPTPLLQVVPVGAISVSRSPYVMAQIPTKSLSERRDAQGHHSLLLEKVKQGSVAVVDVENEDVVAKPDWLGLFTDSAAY